MTTNFTFTIKSSCFDENYNPSENTRITTNFANLARGTSRQENLRNTLVMIDNRFNTLAHWDNPKGDRYSVELEIISVDLHLANNDGTFPAIEILKTNIIDKKTNQRIEGIVGNNFSSYVRDYDFSVLLLEHNNNHAEFSVPDNFGNLHGNIFKHFVNSQEYKDNFKKITCNMLKCFQQRYLSSHWKPASCIGYRIPAKWFFFNRTVFRKNGVTGSLLYAAT